MKPDVVGHAIGLLQVVRDDHDRHVLAQLHDQLLDLLGRLRVERRAGLVEQQHLRLRHQRPRDAEPLLLPAGELQRRMGEVVLDLLEETGAVERLTHRIVQRAAAPPPRALLPQDVGEVVEHAHRKRVRLLEDHRHPAPQRGRLHRLDIDPVQRDPPIQRGRAGQLGEPVERAQERRLAAAGGADQGQDLALANRQVDLLDGGLAVVGDRELLDLHAGDRELRRADPPPVRGREARRGRAVSVSSVPRKRVAALGRLLRLGRVLEVEASYGRWLQEFHEPAFRERRWTTSTAALRNRTSTMSTKAAA